MDDVSTSSLIKKKLTIPIGIYKLQGQLEIPENSNSLVIFSHGSASNRNSPRNKFIAEILHCSSIGTLLIDLLDENESEINKVKFDVEMLSNRLLRITNWVIEQKELNKYNLGYFGSSTGAASALVSASKLGDLIKAIVCRGGRPELADNFLDKIKAPVLFIVGGNDEEILSMNQKAFEKIKSHKRLDIIPKASHLFEEPFALESVSELAADWFSKYLK